MDFTGNIPFFLQNFLSKPATALPKNAQWVLQFDTFPVAAIKKCLQYETYKWNVDAAIDSVTSSTTNNNTKGCLFAQAVQIPGESFTVNPEGLQQNGYLRTTLGAGRDTYNGIQVVFLDTNVSFVDNLIRPWVIATSHLGLIARSGDDNYRTNMSVYKLGVTQPDVAPYIAQKYTFHGICPISVTGEEYNYAVSNTPVNRETLFTYHFYTVDTSENIAATDNTTPSINILSTADRYRNSPYTEPPTPLQKATNDKINTNPLVPPPRQTV